MERARDACRVAGQEADWQPYKAGIIAAHHRKHSLIPLLKDL
jgi:hypothetical protein